MAGSRRTMHEQGVRLRQSVIPSLGWFGVHSGFLHADGVEGV